MMEATRDMLQPDNDAIRADLEHFTRRWGELGEPVWFELRAFDVWGGATIGQFTPDMIDSAVEWAAGLNAMKRNVYAVRNAIRDSRIGGKAATDDDIVAAFFLWADCDDGDASENVRRFDGPKHTCSVVTGTKPAVRVHTYWELEEPCRDLAAWRATQQAIAAHFGSDRVVVNPSRIMRLGGTVSWPSEKKAARGYVAEQTAFNRVYEPQRPPISFERAQRVWDAPQSALSLPQATAPSATAPAATAPQRPAAGAFQIDTGADHAPALDRPAAIASIQAGSEWHNHMISLVASYVAKGMSDEEIHTLTQPLTLPGYTGEQTAREVQTAIDGARRKGWTPEPKSAVNFDHAPAASGEEGGWRLQSAAEFTADFVSPEWLVDGVLQRGRLYTLTAPTGAGKTAAALYMGMAMAAGKEFCGKETEQGDVLFLAGENPDDVRARVIVGLEHAGLSTQATPLHFIPGTFSIRADMERIKEAVAALPNLSLVILDTFAAYFDGDDENSNAQALDFARIVRGLTMLPSRPAVLMPAHPIKNAARNNLTPKGGSSLLNEVDGNLTVWRDDAVVTMHWQGKIRGPDFEPLKMELETVTSDRVRDRRGRHMPSVVASPVLEVRAIELAAETMSREDRVLLSIEAAPALSVADRAISCRIVDRQGKPLKSRTQRVLATLADAKLIVRKHRGGWALTRDGQEAIEVIRSGEPTPAEG